MLKLFDSYAHRILCTTPLKGTRSISKHIEIIRLNKQVRCQEVTKIRQHSSKSSQMWNSKTTMCNLSAQTATVPENRGVSLLQMRALEMMLGNTNQRALHPRVRWRSIIRSLSTEIITVCWKRVGMVSAKGNPVSPICWLSTAVSRSKRIKGIQWT